MPSDLMAKGTSEYNNSIAYQSIFLTNYLEQVLKEKSL
jgi:hypothetical protein